MKEMKKYHKRFVEVTDSYGRKFKFSIKNFIPMQMYGDKDRKYLHVQDVEVLLERTKNKFFSIKMFLEGKSWVKSIRIYESCDQRIKKLGLIPNYKVKQMKSEHYKQADEFVSKMVKHLEAVEV